MWVMHSGRIITSLASQSFYFTGAEAQHILQARSVRLSVDYHPVLFGDIGMVLLPGIMAFYSRSLVILLAVILLCRSADSTSRLRTVHKTGRVAYHRRQYDDDKQYEIEKLSPDDPVKATDEVLQMPNLNNSNARTFAHNNPYVNSDDGDSSQVPWFKEEFKPQPNVQPKTIQGKRAWSWIPSEFDLFPGLSFQLNNDIQINAPDNKPTDVEKVVQPLWVSQPYDPGNIKRAVIVWPGKPRDSWKYVTLMANALNHMYSIGPDGVTNGTVLLVAPLVLNEDDKQAGGADGANGTWAVYHGSAWQRGGMTQMPQMEHKVSMYRAMDIVINWLMNRDNFPNLNQVVVSGHSMGAQATVRYAYMKKTKKYDDNISYWIGNPGSWVWLKKSSEIGGRPVDQSEWSNCTDQVDTWPYGIYNFTNVGYGKDAQQDPDMAIARFRQRRIHYALGLLDNGAGDTHCQALSQGHNHLERGANFIKMLSEMEGGFPVNHTVSYAARISHQDYPMMAINSSLEFIFKKNFDTRFPDRTQHHHDDDDDDDGMGEGPNDFVYRTVAWVLMVAFILAIILTFFLFSRLFTERSNAWDRDYWEGDSKRRLL